MGEGGGGGESTTAVTIRFNVVKPKTVEGKKVYSQFIFHSLWVMTYTITHTAVSLFCLVEFTGLTRRLCVICNKMILANGH